MKKGTYKALSLRQVEPINHVQTIEMSDSDILSQQVPSAILGIQSYSSAIGRLVLHLFLDQRSEQVSWLKGILGKTAKIERLFKAS